MTIGNIIDFLSTVFNNFFTMLDSVRLPVYDNFVISFLDILIGLMLINIVVNIWIHLMIGKTKKGSRSNDN